MIIELVEPLQILCQGWMLDWQHQHGAAAVSNTARAGSMADCCSYRTYCST